MIIPLVKSKFVIPEISDKALYSNRIQNLGIAGHRATVITAPAGFGKTTAVILSLQDVRSYIRWYRMERDDAFFPLFYTHLIDTLFPDQDRASLDCARSLNSLNDVSEEYLLQNALICQDSWSLYADAKHPLYLVFDDFHNVLENSLIAESIRYFIANMPDCIRIIVMSRVDTGIYSGKLASERQFALIDESALLFTEEEARQLFLEKYKLEISSAQIRNIFAFSEGWIAGLTMICHMDNPALLHDKDALSDAEKRDQAGVFRHYFSEFLTGIDPTMLRILAKMSILYDFSCEDLAAIFGISNAQEIVEWLENSNVYIQKFMTAPIKYRFHSLFRIELDAYLRAHISTVEVQNLYLAAAAYYEKQEESKLAIHYYITAGDIGRAKELAAIEGIRIFHSAEPEKVIPLLMEFPDYCVQTDPYLLFFRGISLMSMQSKESFPCFLGALMLFKERKDVKLMMDALGMTIPMSFVKNNYSYIRSAVGLIPKVRVMLANKNGRKKLLLTLFMSLAWSDKLKLGGVFGKLLERMDPVEPVWEYCFYMVKGVVLYRRGQLDEALRNSRIIMNHEAALFSDQWKSVGLSCSHNAPWLMGDMEASQKYLVEFAALAEKYDSAFARGYALRLSAYIKHQTLDFTGMFALMEDAAEAFFKDGNPTMVCVINTTRYLWEAEQNAPEPYAQRAQGELHKLEALNPGQGFLELCQTITGALYKECGEYGKAEPLLLLAYHASRRKKAAQSMCGSLLHLADLYYRQGNFSMEKRYLSLFGKTVSMHGYEYFREMNYTTLVRVCARCMERGIHPEKMQRIIARYFGADGVELLVANPSLAAKDPKAFIAGYTRPKLITQTVRAEFFGTFRLMAGDVQIEEKDWKTRKSSGILKYVLSSGGEPVSRETMATAFWPESDAKAAFTSLRAALYELRKTLARFGMAFDSEHALLAEGKNGFTIYAGISLETDAQAFCALYEQQREKSMSADERKQALMKMVQVYKGDFLPGDAYDEWVSARRDQYRAMFVEIAHALSSIYMEDNEYDEAQALLERLLEMDSLDETACGRLIRLFMLTGRTSRADTLKRQFAKRFEKEMGVKPHLECAK